MSMIFNADFGPPKHCYTELMSDADFAQAYPQQCHQANVKAIRSLQQLVNQNFEYLRDISDFQFDHQIGKGGFGEVWLGNDLRTGKTVAIKELFAENLVGRNLQCFEREIATMAAVNSPFVLSLVGFTIEYPYSIITEFMPNGCLFYLCNRYHRKFQLSGTHQSIIALCLAHGLRELHRQNVIHRDLKSANILLDENRLPKICDFGIAKFFDPRALGRRMTRRIGTYTHMAPEVMSSTEYSLECDVYSYGMILYELAEGRNPFASIKPSSLLLEKVPRDGITPDFASWDIPGPLLSLMRRCWVRNPAARPQWDEIIDGFAAGRFWFSGTDKRAVAAFAASLAGPAEAAAAPPEPVADVGAVLRRLNDRLQAALANTDPDGVLTRVPKDPRAVKQECENTSSEVLSSPDHPRFDFGLAYFGAHLKPSQFLAFYTVVIPHFQSDDEALVDKCLHSFIAIVEREPAFAGMFSIVHFFTKLPLSTERLVMRSFQFVVPIFLHAPEFVDQRMTRAISAFIVNYAIGAAQLFVIYASQFDSLPDPYPIIDHFLAYARSFMNGPAGGLYLHALYHLVGRRRLKNRSDQVRKIFTGFMRSSDLMIVGTAIRAVCATLDAEMHIPFHALCRALYHRETASLALSLLLRVRAYPVSRTLARVLADRALREPRVFGVLYRFADQGPETAAIVVRNPKWMQAGTADAFRLVLVLFKQEDLRVQLIAAPPFAGLCAKLVALGNDEVLAAIPAVLRRSPIEQSHLTALSAASFFHAYYQAVKGTGNRASVLGALTLLDQIGRVGFVPEFALFVPWLQQILALKNEFTGSAAVVLVTMSCHPTIAQSFRGTALVGYFQALLKVPNFAAKAQVFLDNVGV
jgi:serine/threonine protein kinase